MLELFLILGNKFLFLYSFSFPVIIILVCIYFSDENSSFYII